MKISLVNSEIICLKVLF